MFLLVQIVVGLLFLVVGWQMHADAERKRVAEYKRHKQRKRTRL